MQRLKIGTHFIGERDPVYFIADIASNHDGELSRAKELIHLAAEAGAHAAKFQNFRAEKIVSDHGFKSIGPQLSHQAKWKKSVFEVYKDASLPWDWTANLKSECDLAGIDYFSSPYDFEAVDMLDPFVDVYKIGSGEITWSEMLEKVASKHKPVILATGASTLEEIKRAVDTILKINSELVLLQCNTNYTGSPDNFKFINLNVLKTYRDLYPNVILGLSDHTPGHATVLGAIALGAKVIEKHFTDDCTRTGQDHPFSMMPKSWREMVDRSMELELALGRPEKRIEDNEIDTAVVQRRSLRAARNLKEGEIIKRDMLSVLRPCPNDGIAPYQINKVLNKKMRRNIETGEILKWTDLV
jgi:N-acetylneuraminate synthase